MRSPHRYFQMRKSLDRPARQIVVWDSVFVKLNQKSKQIPRLKWGLKRVGVTYSDNLHSRFSCQCQLKEDKREIFTACFFAFSSHKHRVEAKVLALESTVHSNQVLHRYTVIPPPTHPLSDPKTA